MEVTGETIDQINNGILVATEAEALSRDHIIFFLNFDDISQFMKRYQLAQDTSACQVMPAINLVLSLLLLGSRMYASSISRL